MTQDEITKLLNSFDDPNVGMPLLAKMIAEGEGVEEMIKLQDRLEMTAQDYGCSLQEIELLKLVQSRVLIAMAFLRKIKDCGRKANIDQKTLSEATGAWLSLCAKSNFTEFMKGVLATIATFC